MQDFIDGKRVAVVGHHAKGNKFVCRQIKSARLPRILSIQAKEIMVALLSNRFGRKPRMACL
jgi:hypothetical protein